MNILNSSVCMNASESVEFVVSAFAMQTFTIIFIYIYELACAFEYLLPKSKSEQCVALIHTVI